MPERGLEDLSRRPKDSPRRLRADFAELILLEAKRTGYGYKRLSELIKRKYSLPLSPNTIKAVLRKHRVRKKQKKVRRGSRSLYDYESQVLGLKLRAIELLRACIFTLVLCGLRAHGVRWGIRVRMALGSEFCGASARKLAEGKEVFRVPGAEIEPVNKGRGFLQRVVERTHRSDDEEFLYHYYPCREMSHNR